MKQVSEIYIFSSDNEIRYTSNIDEAVKYQNKETVKSVLEVVKTQEKFDTFKVLCVTPYMGN